MEKQVLVLLLRSEPLVALILTFLVLRQNRQRRQSATENANSCQYDQNTQVEKGSSVGSFYVDKLELDALSRLVHPMGVRSVPCLPRYPRNTQRPSRQYA